MIGRHRKITEIRRRLPLTDLKMLFVNAEATDFYEKFTTNNGVGEKEADIFLGEIMEEMD